MGSRRSHWSRPRSCFFCLSAGLLFNNTNPPHPTCVIVNCQLSGLVAVCGCDKTPEKCKMCCGVWEHPYDVPSTVWPTACRYRAVFFSALSERASSIVCLSRMRRRGREGSQASASSHHGVLIRGASSGLESSQDPSRLDSFVASRKMGSNRYGCNQSSPGPERVEPLMGCWTARMGGCKSCDRHPHARQTAMT